jgi:hypothetical protein
MHLLVPSAHFCMHALLIRTLELNHVCKGIWAADTGIFRVCAVDRSCFLQLQLSVMFSRT